jgi:hypothetical protein
MPTGTIGPANPARYLGIVSPRHRATTPMYMNLNDSRGDIAKFTMKISLLEAAKVHVIFPFLLLLAGFM